MDLKSDLDFLSPSFFTYWNGSFAMNDTAYEDVSEGGLKTFIDDDTWANCSGQQRNLWLTITRVKESVETNSTNHTGPEYPHFEMMFYNYRGK
jgi:hypothetical protein